VRGGEKTRKRELMWIDGNVRRRNAYLKDKRRITRYRQKKRIKEEYGKNEK
jgi:hypothetical protein